MADQFLGEIRIFPFTFAPKGWALCDGQVLPISQHHALFALLGFTYGGDGRSTFALPDLRGRVPMHPGQGPGLSARELGEAGGTETVTLLESHLPSHSHRLLASQDQGDSVSLAAWEGGDVYAEATSALGTEGAPGQPHNNLQPYLTLNFCIALEGVFPSQP